MKPNNWLLALLLALLTSCTAHAPTIPDTPLVTTTEPGVSERLSAAIPGSSPQILGEYAVTLLPDYYADPAGKSLFVVVAYLPLNKCMAEIPPYILAEMPQAIFPDGSRSRATSTRSAPCFFAGASTGMIVVMLSQAQACDQPTEIKVTGFVFPAPENFDYQSNHQAIDLQLTDTYLLLWRTHEQNTDSN